jgi:anti-sigma B factor antagonist|nr:STAS domain-containing protein [Terracidiphilus sp.]
MPNAAVASSLTLEVQSKDRQAVVHCRGRLVSETGNMLYNAARELIPNNNCLVLDLTGVTYVDSMGLGTLVRIYVSCKSGGVTLQLINLGKQVRELLGITNLFSVFADMCEHGITPRF